MFCVRFWSFCDFLQKNIFSIFGFFLIVFTILGWSREGPHLARLWGGRAAAPGGGDAAFKTSLTMCWLYMFGMAGGGPSLCIDFFAFAVLGCIGVYWAVIQWSPLGIIVYDSK